MKSDKQVYIVINENRKAFHDFEILEKFEVGIVLTGGEVKSARMKHVSLSGSYAEVLNGELWLVGADIARYSNSNWFDNPRDFMDRLDRITSELNRGEKRNRKLLCHRKELKDFKQQSEIKGLTIVPLKMYIKNGRIKLEIALARGKNKVDKRQTLKNREIDRNIKRI